MDQRSKSMKYRIIFFFFFFQSLDFILKFPLFYILNKKEVAFKIHLLATCASLSSLSQKKGKYLDAGWQCDVHQIFFISCCGNLAPAIATTRYCHVSLLLTTAAARPCPRILLQFLPPGSCSPLDGKRNSHFPSHSSPGKQKGSVPCGAR